MGYSLARGGVKLRGHMAAANVEHPTSNIERRMPEGGRGRP
jgi:hypothetical protein